MSEARVWIADLKDIQLEGTGMSMIATNQPVVSKIDHDAAMKTLRDERDRLREALGAYAECCDGCTCGDGWSHDIAKDALTPAGGEQ